MSKDIKSLFENKYPADRLFLNEELCHEAKGFIEATLQLAPSLDTILEPKLQFINILIEEHSWKLHNTQAFNLEEVTELIEDGLSNGFEYRIQNGKLYFRECSLEIE